MISVFVAFLSCVQVGVHSVRPANSFASETKEHEGIQHDKSSKDAVLEHSDPLDYDDMTALRSGASGTKTVAANYEAAEQAIKPDAPHFKDLKDQTTAATKAADEYKTKLEHLLKQLGTGQATMNKAGRNMASAHETKTRTDNISVPLGKAGYTPDAPAGLLKFPSEPIISTDFAPFNTPVVGQQQSEPQVKDDQVSIDPLPIDEGGLGDVKVSVPDKVDPVPIEPLPIDPVPDEDPHPIDLTDLDEHPDPRDAVTEPVDEVIYGITLDEAVGDPDKKMISLKALSGESALQFELNKPVLEDKDPAHFSKIWEKVETDFLEKFPSAAGWKHKVCTHVGTTIGREGSSNSQNMASISGCTAQGDHQGRTWNNWRDKKCLLKERVEKVNEMVTKKWSESAFTKSGSGGQHEPFIDANFMDYTYTDKFAAIVIIAYQNYPKTVGSEPRESPLCPVCKCTKPPDIRTGCTTRNSCCTEIECVGKAIDT